MARVAARIEPSAVQVGVSGETQAPFGPQPSSATVAVGETEVLDSGDRICALRNYRPGDPEKLTVASAAARGARSRSSSGNANSRKERRRA